MNRTPRLALGLLVALSTVACSPARPPETSKSMTSSQVAAPIHSNMTVEEAEKVVAQTRGSFAQPDAQNPLRNPKSLDDVLAILRTDQIDLFSAGVAFAKKDNSKKARVLEAQLEIAWGENQRIVAQLLNTLDSELREEVLELRELEAAGKLPKEEDERLRRLEALLGDAEPLVPALSRLAPVHLGNGRRLAEGLVDQAPEDYEGYRVLADYARIRGDWEKFDQLLKEVEKRHPTSTGLLFLKGIGVAERSRDFKAASELMQQALAKEPRFVRAQVQLFLFANGIDAKVAEFEKLKASSPQHQLVVLVGPVLTSALEARAARSRRMRNIDWRLAF